MKQLLQRYKKVKAKANPAKVKTKKYLEGEGLAYLENVKTELDAVSKSKNQTGTPYCTATNSYQDSDEMWYDPTLFIGGETKYYVTVDETPEVSWEIQKEQLEIENLLYGYWERNVKELMCCACEREQVTKFTFNEWLEEQLESLED